ncbi:unnamed protein product [Polarella glacialis]|uniref:C2H2-type domain-containing protein n=1 Tax=Polarella glacialis TaxID=89957 RepID=A0A813LKZ3_POLGL|nr:unnamed protein product [Polarella glacialis]
MFVLFLDLEKAFDYTIREFLIGLPQGCLLEPESYLQSLGLDDDVAKELAREVRHFGSLLEQLGVDPKVAALVNSLHSNSWFRYSDLPTVIVARKGGRQGCKLGAIIFNMVYARALLMLRDQLRERGVLLVLRFKPCGPIWQDDSSTQDAHVEQEIVEATYVDDEALLLSASSPSLLDKAIDVLFDCLLQCFTRFSLKINWAPGKSEAMLAYRGKHAVKHREARRRDDGKLWVKLPDHANTPYLTVTRSFKHVGGFVSTDGSHNADASHRVKRAMAAYAPIASSVFGSPHFAVTHQREFANSLVFSRLFYNVRLWSNLAGRPLQMLEGVYARVVRAIGGCRRFSGGGDTDYQVRVALEFPSVECLLSRRRLVYASRLLRRQPASLIALLQQTSGHQRMPWTRLLLDNMYLLWRLNPERLGTLPDPTSEPNPWIVVMRDYPTGWKQLVSTMCFYDSSRQSAAALTSLPLQPSLPMHSCEVCGVCFRTVRALNSHRRRKHNIRDQIRCFVDESGICPVCETMLHTRLRVIRHIKRAKGSNMCHATIVQGQIPRLACDRIEHLDAIDTKSRREAHQMGFSHPRANLPARRHR